MTLQKRRTMVPFPSKTVAYAVLTTLLLGLTTPVTHALSSITATPSTASSTSSSNFLDYLKWGGTTPNFDVIEKTKQYTSEPGYIKFDLGAVPPEYYDQEQYIFRGPVVGPINRKDLLQTNALFGLQESFPDLERQPFGFAVDPENPYRCLFFERWKATHTGDFNFMDILKSTATNQRSISPVFPFAVTWTPEGKIIYECLTTAVDRFEGTTKGKVAVFGLLETAGLSLDNSVNNPFLAIAQRINRFLNAPGQIFSREEDIPSWWKSKARGAESNDM